MKVSLLCLIDNPKESVGRSCLKGMKKEHTHKKTNTQAAANVFSSRNPVRNSFKNVITNKIKDYFPTFNSLCYTGPVTLKHSEFLTFPSQCSTPDIIPNLQAVNIPALLPLLLLSAVACKDKGSSCCKSPINSLLRTAPVGLAFGEMPASSAGIFSCSDGSIQCTRSQTFSKGCKHSEQISNPSLSSGREQRACARLQPSLTVGLCCL